MRFSIALILAVFALGFWPAQQAHAGFWDFLFPEKDTSLEPSRTLKAPFADPPSESEEVVEEKLVMPEDAVPMNLPHRNTEEISAWLVTAVSEAMTFDQGDYRQDLKNAAQYFDDGGRGQYEEFLQDNNILKILKSKKYHVRSFVREAPLLLNEGEVAGRYRWLFELPMMASYMDRSMTDYKKKAEPVNQAIKLTVQVGRSPDASGEMKVQIERWIGKAAKLSTK